MKKGKGKHTKSLLQFFGGPTTEIDLVRGVQRLTFLINKKINEGDDISPVEAHLYNNIRALKKNSFGPTLLSTGYSIGSALFAPLLLLAFLICVAILILHSSSGFFSTRELAVEDVERAVFESYAEADVSNGELLDSNSAATDEGKLDLTLSALVESESSKQGASVKSLVPFLAGVIAIHQPGIGDCGKIARDIVELSRKKNVDPFLVASIIATESRFHVEAKSSVGAVGLMQVLPSTGKEIFAAITGKKSYPTLTDTRTNISLGIEYLKQLENEFYGNRFYALAAYNWGAANVRKTVSEKSRMPKSVSKYATAILERTTRWQKHFRKAEKSALDAARVEAIRANKSTV